jgi:hypothetical protein
MISLMMMTMAMMTMMADDMNNIDDDHDNDNDEKYFSVSVSFILPAFIFWSSYDRIWFSGPV